MAHYAIGDIHGCLDSLKALLDQLRFDPAHDRLWLTGDLVGRGPEPAATLRFVRDLGPAAEAVLGNHDIHCLAVAAGEGKRRRDDNLEPLLGATDRDALIDWLRRRPLLIERPVAGWALVHAGIPPGWTLADARMHAAAVEAWLQGDDWVALLANLYGNEPDQWDEALSGWPRCRFIINALTRMRYCSADGRLLLRHNGPPESAPADHYPWYEAPGSRIPRSDITVIAGHWSRLGRRAGPGYLTLDTGCLWGGQLTAARLDTPRPQFTTTDCRPALKPG